MHTTQYKQKRENAMPNLCENELTITPLTEVTDSEALLKALRGEDGLLSFEAAVPSPEQEPDPDDDDDDHEWVSPPDDEWCIENWGTKWDVADGGEITVDESGVIRSFLMTAWQPPLVWLTALAERFPDYGFELEYLEHNMRVGGKVTIRAGSSADEIDRSYVDFICRHISMGEPVSRIVEWQEKDGIEFCLSDTACPSVLLNETERQLLNGGAFTDLTQEESEQLMAKVKAHPNYEPATD